VNAANALTGSRILLSVAMLFTASFTPPFYALYLAAGFTDAIDGTVARRTGKDSEFGAKFDTLADIVFVFACLVTILPCLDIPLWLWLWVGVIALLKVVNIATGYFLKGEFVTVHSNINKVTGLLLFIFPFTVPFVPAYWSGAILCAVATIAAIHEDLMICSSVPVNT